MIEEFWRWWATCPHPDAASIDRRIHALDSGLAWELSPGSLTVHANGDPTLRALAARWAASAPTVPGWEFLSARPPSPTPLSGTVTAAGVRVNLSQLSFTAHISPDRPELDVTGVHPGFASMPAATARQVTELALAEVLGETRLDLWIGTISTSTEPECATPGCAAPGGAAPWCATLGCPALRDAAPTSTASGDAVPGRAAPGGAGPGWTAPGGAGPAWAALGCGGGRLVAGGPGAETPADVTAAGAAVRTTADARHMSGEMLLRFVDDFASLERWRTWSRVGGAAVRLPLRAARWPRFDTHLAVSRSANWRPADSRPADWRPADWRPVDSRPDDWRLGLSRPVGAPQAGGSGAPERVLERAVGADGVVVAWEHGGRVAHVYVDGSSAAPALVEACAGQGAVIERGYDPTFAEVHHLAAVHAAN